MYTIKSGELTIKSGSAYGEVGISDNPLGSVNSGYSIYVKNGAAVAANIQVVSPISHGQAGIVNYVEDVVKVEAGKTSAAQFDALFPGGKLELWVTLDAAATSDVVIFYDVCKM